MNMKYILASLVFVVLAIPAAVFVADAYGPSHDSIRPVVSEEYHDQIENIVEDGTYDDLVSFREETGLNVPRWVDSEDDFDAWKTRHQEMESFFEQGGEWEDRPKMGMGHGMHGSQNHDKGSGNGMRLRDGSGTGCRNMD